MPEISESGQGFCLVCGTPLESRPDHEDRDRPTCRSCGFIHYLDPKIAVAVILGDEYGVLLGRRRVDPSSGRWSFPAGYVNRGEVLEEAAAREVLEEFGVDVRLTGLVGVYSERGEPVVLIVYSGEIEAGEPRPDGHEVSDVQRFGLDALPGDLAFPHDRQVLADWKRARQTGRLSGATNSTNSYFRLSEAKNLMAQTVTREPALHSVSVTVNGTRFTREVEARQLLVYFVREQLGLTGTHVGCDTSQCGACTILVDGIAVKSCTILAVQADGADIKTIEAYAEPNGKLHPIQQAFWEEHGLQCGFCTPGMVIAIDQLLRDNPNPSEADVRRGLDGNLCRCTGYQNIVKSALSAGRKLRGEEPFEKPDAANEPAAAAAH